MLKNEILAKLQDIQGNIDDNPQEAIRDLDIVIHSINFNSTFTQKELIGIIIKDIGDNDSDVSGILKQLYALYNGLNE